MPAADSKCKRSEYSRFADFRAERFNAFRIALPMLCLIILSMIAAPSEVLGESVAAKNKRGNRLFEEGKFQEAERAYLDAQAESPDRPELLYNLGNSLIKQKKYQQGVQSLRQAGKKSSRELQANSWYNMGNAFFDKGEFKEAADAYIQSLKMRPADHDAKYNLELALRNLQQQQQKKQGASKDSGNNQQKRDQDTKPDESAGKESRDNQQPPDRQQQQHKQNEQNGTPRPDEQSRQSARPEEKLTKEQAMQILDALRNEELLNQKKLREHSARRKAIGKDW